MENLTVVTIENEDQLQRCLAVRREVFIEEQQVPEELEIDAYDAIGSSAGHVLLSTENGDAAAGRFTPYKDGAAKMQRVAVRSAYRGQGVGRALMTALEDSARRSGYRRAVLDSQCHAEKFYLSLGYRTVPGEPFYDAGILHVRMEKEL
ncbi:GNAT family N-acetyltransferase [Saccharibacillus alkalitolerans]|uniref:GNAT family N-acetyltransferase n=1 Tax=Saccharibacillus alkalitolerans TaxID=2705290 RepID=A0ABX0F1X7_9BACL|nr:GNAT family N-acetyltransferase [Saccharibacillus alkalitolerans]NGZ73939.1 GNAT family N-acetyltransferase [Saccharibacillus alkalitolerans]